jgi:hypothetical protein
MLGRFLHRIRPTQSPNQWESLMQTPKHEGNGSLETSEHVHTPEAEGVVGIAAAAFEVALLPGIVLGVAAVAAPKYLPKMGAALNPLFRSTVRGAYKIGQKTKEVLAEAHEQVNDIVAEVHAEGDVNQPATKPTAAS